MANLYAQSLRGTGGFDINSLMSMLMPALEQYQSFIANPLQSPLYQGQLQGLLSALEPSEQRATTNLADIFRGAGNMSSGIYGTAASNLQSELARNRQTLASQLLGQVFGQGMQAYGQPLNLFSNLIGTLMSRGGMGGGGRGGGGMISGGGGGGSVSMPGFSTATDPYWQATQQKDTTPYEVAYSPQWGGFSQYGTMISPPVDFGLFGE